MTIPTRSTFHRVLIVDQSRDSREVLRTALARRGVQTYETSHARTGLELAQRYQPDVIVVDLEAFWPNQDADASTVCRQFDSGSARHRASLVFLGEARGDNRPLPTARFIRKPYHYAPLIRTILECLQAKTPEASHASAPN